MSVGDVNSVDPTVGIDPTGGVYPSTVQGFDPEHVTLFRRAIESAQNNTTAGQRYAFNNLNQTTTDAAPGVKTPPSNAPVSQPNNWLSDIARGFGIIGGGLTAAQLLKNYAARQHTVTEYYGSELALRVYPEGQPGPDGAKANFLETGPNTPYGREKVLPVTAAIKEDVRRYDRQPLKEFVQFDPTELGHHYDLSTLSPDDRARLGLPALTAGGNASDGGRKQPAGIDPTESPGNRNNLEGIEIRSREEQEFVNGLSPHLTREEIQAELDGFRRRNGTADGAGGSKPPTNDTPPAAPETVRPLGPGEMLERHVQGKYGLLANIDRAGMLNLLIAADKKNDPPTTPKGGEMFEEAVRAFGPNVTGIRGNWIGTDPEMSDNFVAFKGAIKSGLSPEEAAFHTFTGHMAAKSGFTHATVVLNNDEKVIVEFRR